MKLSFTITEDRAGRLQADNVARGWASAEAELAFKPVRP
jgi:hypothetical protein